MDSFRDGAIRRAEALGDGNTDRELRRARTTGDLVPIRPGSYLRAADFAALDTAGQHRALTIATATASNPDAVVSHVSAAVLHGIDVWAIPLDRVHQTVDRRQGGKRGRRRHLHATPFRDDEVTVRAGVRCTSAARTVVDLARTVPFEQAVVVGDCALHNKLVTPDELAVAVASAHHRSGVNAAARAVAFMDGRSESVGESRSRVLMHRLRLPKPDLQRWMSGSDGTIGRVDFFWECGLVGEFDGLGKYKKDRAPDQDADDAVIAEKAREDLLRAEGFMVVRWVWRELSTPDVVARRIRRGFEIC
ncbi:hypothetical protein [Rhodococcus sp. NPDC058514]|uniref:hypothetical protein n=1 Tax=unclassified Rhodococcus (in: high G+C Gram-positive bacteria) TaxID=192944 RepID=UPI00365CF5D0